MDNKPIRKAWEMTREEYAEQMRAGLVQLKFAKSIKFDVSKIPADMQCYHGNLLLTCPSFNCEVDSGRMKPLSHGITKMAL